MKVSLEERAVEHGLYIVKNKATVRETAKYFNISKTAVHKDVAERLKQIDGLLWDKVLAILEINKNERALRGGESTKAKFEKLRRNNFPNTSPQRF